MLTKVNLLAAGASYFGSGGFVGPLADYVPPATLFSSYYRD